MKYLAFFIISLLTQYSLNAQEVDGKSEVDKTNQVYTFVEHMPQFPGGDDELFKYIGKSIKYPKKAKKKGIQGTVYITFVVEIDGTLSGIKVLRGVHKDIDKEAIRTISTMPKWKNGSHRDTPARVQMNLPIRFTLKDIE
jgi:protein TonB